jgi:hypothetical protein
MKRPSFSRKARPAAATARPPFSDAALKAKTGRDWAAWCARLDAAGASALSHREIVQIVRRHGAGSDWWAQMITVGYERLRGRRAANQRPTGFAVSASKTIAATAPDVFAAWTDPRRRARWLAGVNITVRATTAPRSLHLTCDDDASEIEVRITAKGRAKCAVTVDHTKLASAQLVAERRHCWKEMLRGLQQYLERLA